MYVFGANTAGPTLAEAESRGTVEIDSRTI